MTAIENIIPILRVQDIDTSRRFYTDALGFSLDWDVDTMISVSRNGKSIMLCEGDQGQPGTWLWVGVEDADVLFNEFSAKGATIRQPPKNFSWAYEFQVQDPDGHVLRFFPWCAKAHRLDKQDLRLRPSHPLNHHPSW